jgi:hypothetical protein
MLFGGLASAEHADAEVHRVIARVARVVGNPQDQVMPSVSAVTIDPDRRAGTGSELGAVVEPGQIPVPLLPGELMCTVGG